MTLKFRGYPNALTHPGITAFDEGILEIEGKLLKIDSNTNNSHPQKCRHHHPGYEQF